MPNKRRQAKYKTAEATIVIATEVMRCQTPFSN
jgi:hypothetical protein